MPGSFATVRVPLVDSTAPNWSTQSFSITSGSAVFKCTCPYVIPAAFGGASCANAGCASTHANAAMTNDLITVPPADTIHDPGAYTNTGSGRLVSQPVLDRGACLTLQALLFSGEVDAGAALAAGHGIVRAGFRRGRLEACAAALRAFEREFDLRH